MTHKQQYVVTAKATYDAKANCRDLCLLCFFCLVSGLSLLRRFPQFPPACSLTPLSHLCSLSPTTLIHQSLSPEHLVSLKFHSICQILCSPQVVLSLLLGLGFPVHFLGFVFLVFFWYWLSRPFVCFCFFYFLASNQGVHLDPPSSPPPTRDNTKRYIKQDSLLGGAWNKVFQTLNDLLRTIFTRSSFNYDKTFQNSNCDFEMLLQVIWWKNNSNELLQNLKEYPSLPGTTRATAELLQIEEAELLSAAGCSTVWCPRCGDMM